MNTMAHRLYVLDTNVLMHDPTALFRFAEHDIFLPMAVMEELDAAKKGVSEVARNARQVSRFLDELIGDADHARIESGLALPAPGEAAANGLAPSGKLFLQTNLATVELPSTIPGTKSDNVILATTLALKDAHADREVTLVSKDINLRIKARILGISAEEYHNDQVLDDVNLLYSGAQDLASDFWNSAGDAIECWQDSGKTFYRLPVPGEDPVYPGEFLYTPDEDGIEVIVRSVDEGKLLLEQLTDYRNQRHSIWGITARNREQNFAMNLLMDPEVDFVTILGTAGTGKTLLAMAAGLVQTMEDKRYREIIVTRETVPVGEDIGFLPGTEEEKMTPWMGALMDNLEVLTATEVGGEWGRAATEDLLKHRIKIRSLNYMRGRTFLNRFIVIDEAQNLTAKQMKTLITRAGPGSKVICLGNIGQIDTPYLSATTSGLTYVVDRFKHWEHAGHIILMRGERSRLADYAALNL